MMYLDANFFVFALLDTTEKGEAARKLRVDIIRGKKAAITSVLALDEVMWYLLKGKKSELIRMAIEHIYATPNLAVKEVPALAALTAVDILEQYELKPRDAFHAATMKAFGVNTIVTDDADFDRIPWIKRVGI